MRKQISKVIVLGGGTSGWLSAALLASSFKKNARNIEVHLIESENIATIGVGEGTFPTILNTLHDIGLSEKEFLSACDAAFKQGAEFRNWLYDPAEKAHAYYHPFDPPATPKGINLASQWLKRNKDDLNKSFSHGVTLQAHLCDKNLAPKQGDTSEYEWLAKYAYHLDASKLGELVKEHSINKLDVKHTYADIEQASLDDEGYIDHLIAKNGETFPADFFVDCTGFRGLLISQTLGVPFVDKSKYLSVDSAVTLQVPYESSRQKIATHTISTAQEAGWIWDIGLQTRRGCGYVYSSKHTSKERAEEVFKQYLGIEDQELELRHIHFTSGYREKSWHKNCVANGFASGFVEPLEATAIAMVEAGARSLAARFPETREAMEVRQKQYNEIFVNRWDNIIDFIKLHYCLTKRTDTEFWREQTMPENIPGSLLEKLEAWKHYAVSEGDFPNKYDIFGLASWQYILYGLEFYPKFVECADIPEDFIDKALASIQIMATNAHRSLLSNRDTINSYKQTVKFV
ncbi:tryptophan 7-halogenase [Catenovulum sp. SM1970]|uniref:tryptophan halogenase family protein n=1 Tax=Marinifaba aquimaris TaxID=2741323 RepID=UPI001571E49B|nr:tryptophan halogenase family protein [Marinifaba aquimaris]NTS78660.1 tryptophan 7-halogenase [Marinifaba aquimaris]